MSRQRNLGRLDPGPYPLLPRCKECNHVLPNNPEHPELIAHWPWCSKGNPLEWQDRYTIPPELQRLRALRSARRVGE